MRVRFGLGVLLLAAAVCSPAAAIEFTYSPSAEIDPHTVTATQPFTAVLQISDWCPADTSMTGSADWGDGQTSPVSVKPRGDGRCAFVASHTYARAGSFTVHMSGNWWGASSSSTPIEFTVIDFRLAARAQKGLAGKELAWNIGSFPQSSDSGPYTAVVSWGDGTESAVAPSFGRIPGAHTYAQPGLYPVKVSVLLNGESQGEVLTRALISSCSPDLGDSYVPALAGAYERWLTLLYHDALGRLPLRAEIDATMRALINGATRRSVASAVLRSPEASERAATRMYDALLGRPRAVGEPTSIADIIGGQEYADLVQPDSSGSDAGKVVRTAACDLLGRAATDAELQLALAAPTREQAAAAFLGSSAYGEGLVKQLYHRYLRRMANRAEARKLAGPPEQVAAAIAGSSEYFQRANGGGALVRVSALPDGRIRLELSRRAELRLGVIRRGKRIATRRLGRRPQGWSSADWHGAGHVAVIVEAWSHGRMIDASDPVLLTR